MGDISQPTTLGNFPEFAEAHAEKIEVELNAGDSLFIPANVWQFVKSWDVGK
jgi:hypothetical protein